MAQATAPFLDPTQKNCIGPENLRDCFCNK